MSYTGLSDVTQILHGNLAGVTVRGVGTTNDWINPAAVVGLPLQKTVSAAWVESFVRRSIKAK